MRTKLLAVPAVVIGALFFLGSQADPVAAEVVTVNVGSFYFEDGSTGSRAEVRANVGDQLRFVFESGGHSAEVDELGISTGTQGSGAVYVTAPISQAGTFELYCRPHRNLGHRTTLVVLDPQATTTTTQAPTTTTQAPTTTTQAPTTTVEPDAPTTTSPGDSEEQTSTTTTVEPDAPTTTSPGDSEEQTSTTTAAEPSGPSDDTTPQDEGDAATDAAETAAAPSETDVQEATTQSDVSETVPFGLVVPPSNRWLWALWTGLLAGIPIWATAFIALRRAPTHRSEPS
ncbi:MAG: cupredoxin domain-containing protein [Acidimicrobiales bacterium]